jgi:hypothetical protein
VIGNKIGSFIGLEPNWASKTNRHWAWIQVEVDTREGLVGNVDIIFGDRVWHQKVYYWKIPFRCHGCHEIRHLCVQCGCPTPLTQKVFKTWKAKSTLGRSSSVDIVSVGRSKEVKLPSVGTLPEAKDLLKMFQTQVKMISSFPLLVSPFTENVEENVSLMVVEPLDVSPPSPSLLSSPMMDCPTGREFSQPSLSRLAQARRALQALARQSPTSQSLRPLSFSLFLAFFPCASPFPKKGKPHMSPPSPHSSRAFELLSYPLKKTSPLPIPPPGPNPHVKGYSLRSRGRQNDVPPSKGGLTLDLPQASRWEGSQTFSNPKRR